MLRLLLLLTLLFVLLLALACASTPEPRNMADSVSCDALMSIFSDELRDNLLIQACAQEHAQECIGHKTACIQDKVYLCLEQYFLAKKMQVESIRKRKCYITLDSVEPAM